MIKHHNNVENFTLDCLKKSWTFLTKTKCNEVFVIFLIFLMRSTFQLFSGRKEREKREKR